jgi:diaminopimelate epimerase
MVEHPGEDLMTRGRRFFKMSGSGNDFVFLDTRGPEEETLNDPEAVRAICARGTGVGADGVVFLAPTTRNSLGMRYYNSDGSLGELCGNATLCALRLASDRGMVGSGEVSIQTDAGVVTARMADGQPEIDLAPVTEVAHELPAITPNDREELLGFVRAGVPHIVIIDQDVGTADIIGRGSKIRRDPSLRDGANVNFLSRSAEGWSIRTYERGVEAETLACGTGAVASGILLAEWGRATSPVTLRTRSGRELQVRVRRDGDKWFPSLRGHAEMVFVGELAGHS